MDLMQIVIGLGLLAVSGVTFVGPSGLDPAVHSLLTAIALLVGAGVLFRTVAREAQVS